MTNFALLPGFDVSQDQRRGLNPVAAKAMWFAAVLAIALGLVVAGLSGPALAQSADDAARIKELQQRVDQLEEQLVDMQVVIGTLETLARQGGAAPARPVYNNGGGGSNVEARLSSLETQIQALASQLGGGGGASYQPQTYDNSQNQSGSGYQTNGFGQLSVDQSAGGTQDGIGQFITETDRGTATATPSIQSSRANSPDELYKEASSHLLQQDYGAAEASFKEFLARYPQDRLAGNAQYWIGESHYMRGQYREAADAFLQGFKRDRSGEKAPDSLLKLAMSLTRLGQKEAACATFAEMDNAFPSADAKIKRRSQSERQRAGC